MNVLCVCFVFFRSGSHSKLPLLRRFQDELFCNHDRRLEFRGNNVTALWPGDGKPGLWMNPNSRMGAIYSLIVGEEEILMEQGKIDPEFVIRKERDEDIELMVPPVFSSSLRLWRVFKK
ncbi:unnamed protein product [Eruca vesicaria subsp. sativa]|uniref:Uncharacterized protein n=1 Tax=Eruca vesicaria subsp. sativa TaxID=29727 RepID=A0ABC8M0Q4_ERUVS|nr:unnamed protein product [Eruca vesicaria subsp. sativa]